MKILLVHPGASWSTADVFSGLAYGLRQIGADVTYFRLDDRIEYAQKWLHTMQRKKNKDRKAAGLEPFPKPTRADVMYHAGVGALEMALRHKVDVVLVVSAMLLHPDVVILMKRAGLRVTVLFTESPYDIEAELKMAALVDGCWTNERTCVPAFAAVNPRSGYLPHAWHPEKHFRSARAIGEIPSHDVVFVGSGFRERIAFFNAIDWTAGSSIRTRRSTTSSLSDPRSRSGSRSSMRSTGRASTWASMACGTGWASSRNWRSSSRAKRSATNTQPRSTGARRWG
jgi:hypothetical protein